MYLTATTHLPLLQLLFEVYGKRGLTKHTSEPMR